MQHDSKIKKIRRYLLNDTTLFFNHIAALSLLLAYVAPYISPEKFWILAFFGLTYPILVIINLFFVLYWLIQLKNLALYSLSIILLGWLLVNSFFQISFDYTPQKSKTQIKVLSYNVKVFDLYNWSHNLVTRSNIYKLITDENANIMCLQEFFSRDNNTFNNLDSLIAIQKAKYVHVEYTTTVEKIHHWGIATFSAYPIVSKGRVDFGYRSNNICIYTDVKIKNDTVRIYNMHLQSIAFANDDYQYMDDIQNNKETEDLKHSKNIGKRLKRAFIKRAKQADLIKQSINESPYPVIICGDFNDTPSSYTYHHIKKNLSDAFVESGNGFGKTYIGKFPSFRIDYILHSKQFKAYDFTTIHKELSDHYPITTFLEKK